MKRAMMLCFIFLLWLMVGCSKDEQPEESFEQERQESVDQKDTKESPPLKVLTNYEQKDFDRLYGTAFIKKYPNIRIELIPINLEKPITESIEQNNPDIVIAGPYHYRDLAQAGMLAEINNSVIDIENFHPKLISYLEAVGGDGKLYGLTDVFAMKGLKYNKKLFDRYEFEYPTDGMTWDELFQLAKKFPNKEEGKELSYGFYHHDSSIANLIHDIVKTSGLSYFDQKGRVNLHTDEWKYVLTLLQEGLSKRYFYQPLGTKDDLFKMNRAAMTLTYITINELQVEEYGFVTVPSGLRLQTNQTLPMYPNNMISVTTKAKHPDAWEFMKYVNSEEWAKQNLDRTYGLPARINLIPENQRKKIASLLELEVDMSWLNADNSELTKKQKSATSKVESGLHALFLIMDTSGKGITDADITKIEEEAQSAFITE